MPIAASDRLYAGMGIQAQGSPLDSGAIAKTASPATVSVTVPANADGTQPKIDHGTVCMAVTAVNAAALLGACDFYASDGTNTEFLWTAGAPGTGVAGQGETIYDQVYSALVNITTIKTLSAKLISTTNNNLTMDLRFNFGP